MLASTHAEYNESARSGGTPLLSIKSYKDLSASIRVTGKPVSSKYLSPSPGSVYSDMGLYLEHMGINYTLYGETYQDRQS